MRCRSRTSTTYSINPCTSNTHYLNVCLCSMCVCVCDGIINEPCWCKCNKTPWPSTRGNETPFALRGTKSYPSFIPATTSMHTLGRQTHIHTHIEKTAAAPHRTHNVYTTAITGGQRAAHSSCEKYSKTVSHDSENTCEAYKRHVCNVWKSFWVQLANRTYLAHNTHESTVLKLH